MALGAPARADDLRRVELELVACPLIAEAEVRRVIAIEIGDLLVSAREPVPPDADRMTIQCEGGVERIDVVAKGRDQPLRRTIRFADFPGDAAPRALALAAIEVLAALSPALRQRIENRRGSGAATETNGTDPRKPDGSAPASESSSELKAEAPKSRAQPNGQADQEEPPRTGRMSKPTASGTRVLPVPLFSRVGVAALYRWFPALGVSGVGGKLDVDREVLKNLNLAVDIEAFEESKSVTQGNVHGLLGSLGAFAGFGGPGTWGAVAVGGRLGVAHLEGDPTAGSTVTGGQVLRPWAGPALALRGFANMGSLSLELSAEAGVALSSAQGLAAGSAQIGASSSWLSLSVGPGLRFRR